MAQDIYGSVNNKTDLVTGLYGSVGGQGKEIVRVYGSVEGKTRIVFESEPAGPSPWGGVYYQLSADDPTIYEVQLRNRSEFEKLTIWNDTTSISVGGTHPITLYVDKDTYPSIRGARIGEKITEIPNQFLGYCTGVNQPIIIPDIVTSIGAGFLAECSDFNQPVEIPASVVSIGGSFLYNATSFNSTITLHDGLQSIGNSFLWGCTAFNQPLEIPDTVTTVGEYFMVLCKSFDSPLKLSANQTTMYLDLAVFNQPLVIPDTMKEINYFSLPKFNQPLTIPDGVEVIRSFLSNAAQFDQPVVLPQSLKIMGNECFSGTTRLSYSFEIPSGVTEIGRNFMWNQRNRLNVPAIPEGCTTIDDSFLSVALVTCDHPYVVPSSITSIGSSFLYGTSGISTVQVECSFPKATGSTNFWFAGSGNPKTTYLQGPYAAEWKEALPDTDLRTLIVL